MKNTTLVNSLLAAAVCVMALAFPPSLTAQTVIDNTTLTVAITTTSAQRVSLAAITCTGCTFGDGFLLLVDDEVMAVTGAWSSGATNIPVIRGYAGIVGTHANGATVMYGPGPGSRAGQTSRFKSTDPPLGSCTRVSQQFMPWVNIGSGPSNVPIRVWGCDNVNWFYGLNPSLRSTRPLS